MNKAVHSERHLTLRGKALRKNKFVGTSEKKCTYKLYDNVKTAHKVEMAQHSFSDRHFNQENLLIIIINCLKLHNYMKWDQVNCTIIFFMRMFVTELPT